MGRTHALAGISTLWLLALVPGGIAADAATNNAGFLAAVAAVGALLPDLDASQSKLRSWSVGGVRPFVPLSIVINRAWGHRGLLHSAVGLAITGAFAVGLVLLWGWQPSVALWLGYASHLAADACTRTGIPFLPRHDRRYHLLPERLRFTTGSPAEDMLLPLLATAAMLLLLTHSSRPGL
jgi:inner membrane protein